MTNKLSPYTIYNGTKTPQCTECVINILSNYTDSKSNLEIISSEYGTFRQMYEIENILEGKNYAMNFIKIMIIHGLIIYNQQIAQMLIK